MKKTAQTILEEYRKTPVRTDFICDAERLELYLDGIIDEMREELKDLRKDQEVNRRRKLGERIRQFVFFLYNPDLIDFYDVDNSILDEIIDLMIKFMGYYETIQQTVTDSTTLEFTRLMDFTKKYYNENYDHLSSERDSLQHATMGIQSFNPKYEDTRESFDEFFQKRIEVINQFLVEKAKEI